MKAKFKISYSQIRLIIVHKYYAFNLSKLEGYIQS